MPRKKMISTKNNGTRVLDVTEGFIANSNCLEGYIYMSELDEKTYYLIENFCKCKIKKYKNGISFTCQLKNSWKGLLQLLLSILYIKEGGKIVCLQAKHKFVKHTHVDLDFEMLGRGGNKLERLHVPKSYRPMYTSSKYKDKDIVKTLEGLCEALKIDKKISKVITKPNNGIHNYKSKFIDEKVDCSNLICSIVTPVSNSGTAIVESETMKDLLDENRILVVHPTKTPEQAKAYNEVEWDPTYPYKFLAYPILKLHKEDLASYFPLMGEVIREIAEKTDQVEHTLGNEYAFTDLGCDYIITDFIAMGKWG